MEPPPATITQLNCERWFGISAKTFVRLAREGRIPAVTPKRGVWLALYDEVREALLHPQTPRINLPEEKDVSDAARLLEKKEARYGQKKDR
jgi:predicted MarR family transcription regulator